MHEIPRPELQYLNHFRNILENGHDIHNARTGEFCRTLINCDMTYDASTAKAPILTTRKVNAKIAIAELLGYIRGYTNAQQFAEIGTKTWFANANETQAWVNNPSRKGTDDLGLIYGAVAKQWPVVHPDAGKPVTLDLFHKVYDNLKAGKDDRGELISFWHPGMFHLGALRPCMYEHQFSMLGDDLYLNSVQRSADWPLGATANMIQCWLLLRLMAQITGKNPKIANHRSVNCHIYEPQLELARTQLDRPILAEPQIHINPDIKTLEDLETWVTLDDFEIIYPEYGDPIKYPFAA